jgi:hypothetical protein
MTRWTGAMGTMSNGKSDKGGKPDRDERLAERLRENLRKRKQQARSRASSVSEDKPDPSGNSD